MERFRHKNAVQTVSLGPIYEQYRKPSGGCTGSLAWETYGTNNATRLVGHVEWMRDTFNNAPQRELGTAGYRFNPMHRVVVDVPVGTGTGWQCRNVNPNCSTNSPYYVNWRRTERGLPAALEWSGLHIVGWETQGANTVDLGLYGVPWQKIDDMRTLVSTSVRSQRGRGSDSNLWESLAELDKSMAMVAAYADKARGIVKAAFSRRAAGRKLSNEAAGLHLMTRYGFVPTLKDIFNTLLAIERELGRVVERTRAQESDKWSTTTNTVLTDGAAYDFSCKTVKNENLTVRAVSVDEYVLTLAQSLGLGMKNLLTTPYELVKLSFVLDWFINLGDFIGAMAPNFSLVHIGGCTSVTYEAEWTFTGTPTGITPSRANMFTSVSGPSVVTQSRTLLYKQRDQALPSPAIKMKSDFKFDNLLRAADALALVTQQLSKIPPKWVIN